MSASAFDLLLIHCFAELYEENLTLHRNTVGKGKTLQILDSRGVLGPHTEIPRLQCSSSLVPPEQKATGAQTEHTASQASVNI